MRERNRRWSGDCASQIARRVDGRFAFEHATLRHIAQHHESQEEAVDQVDTERLGSGRDTTSTNSQSERAAQASRWWQSSLGRRACRTHQETRRRLIPLSFRFRHFSKPNSKTNKLNEKGN